MTTLRGAMTVAVGPERAGAAAVSAWAMVHGLSLLLLDDQIPSAVAAGRTPVELAGLVLRAFGKRTPAGQT